MRRLLGAALAALIAAGCSDMLEGVGGTSRGFVYGARSTDETTTTLPQERPDLRLGPLTQVTWSNDGLGVATVGLEGPALLLAVWDRGDRVSAFVQSARSEISAALPDVEFPQLVPAPVTHISSQLVFDTQTGLLDVSTAAAFGMWVGEPYALPRSEAQLAVLRVGPRTVADVETGDFLSFQVADGRELAWVKGDYLYQLFCRTGISDAACRAIAESTFPLRAMLEI